MVPQVGEFQHLFDIAQAIGPRAKVRAGEGTAVRERVIIQKAIEISEKVTPGPAYVGTTASIGAAALGSLSWFIAGLVSRLLTPLLAIGLTIWFRVSFALTLLLTRTATNRLLARRLLLRVLSCFISFFLRLVLVFCGQVVCGLISCRRALVINRVGCLPSMLSSARGIRQCPFRLRRRFDAILTATIRAI